VSTRCDKCKKKLYQLQFEFNNLFLQQKDDSLDKTDSGNEINTYCVETAVQSLNESLQNVRDMPVRLKRRGETNCTIKLATTGSAVRKKIFGILSDEGTSALPAGPDSIKLQQIKEKFSETVVSNLTLLPKDCSITQQKNNFQLRLAI
jgi:hypothetical protein